MIRKLAAYVILGINTEGKKEVLTISMLWSLTNTFDSFPRRKK
ncbi:hypothetical protein [Blautia wexlerae]